MRPTYVVRVGGDGACTYGRIFWRNEWKREEEESVTYEYFYSSQQPSLGEICYTKYDRRFSSTPSFSHMPTYIGGGEHA